MTSKIEALMKLYVALAEILLAGVSIDDYRKAPSMAGDVPKFVELRRAALLG